MHRSIFCIKYRILEKILEEYWIIDPANPVIEVFSLQKEKYTLYAFVTEKGGAASKLFKS
jgi:Uma2 family endonuclease